MNTVVSDTPRIIELQITDDSIVAHLADGRVISVPLAWSWRLSEATPAQRSNFEFIGSGLGVHWPDIAEDISATGMLPLLQGGLRPPSPDLNRCTVAQLAAGMTYHPPRLGRTRALVQLCWRG